MTLAAHDDRGNGRGRNVVYRDIDDALQDRLLIAFGLQLAGELAELTGQASSEAPPTAGVSRADLIEGVPTDGESCPIMLLIICARVSHCASWWGPRMAVSMPEPPNLGLRTERTPSRSRRMLAAAWRGRPTRFRAMLLIMLSHWRHDVTAPSRAAHPRPVTVASAATYAHVSRRTVAGWVHESLLTPAVAGTAYRPRVDLADVDTLTGPAGYGSDEADERLWTPTALPRRATQDLPT